MASAELIARFQDQYDNINAELLAYQALEAHLQDAEVEAELQANVDSAQLCLDNPDGIVAGRINNFQLTFATSDTVGGADIEIPAAHTKGTIHTGYSKVKITNIDGISDRADASGAGDVTLNIYARPTSQGAVRGIGEGTLLTSQVLLSAGGVVADERDAPLCKDLKDDPIDVTACAGYRVFAELSLGTYTLEKPSITLEFEGEI